MRTTRLSHPPVLTGTDRKLIYGSGIPAPWNTSTPSTASTSTGTIGKGSKENGSMNLKEKEPTLRDAMLFATWDYEKKDFRQGLVAGRRLRGSGGTLGSGVGSRTWS